MTEMIISRKRPFATRLAKPLTMALAFAHKPFVDPANSIFPQASELS